MFKHCESRAAMRDRRTAFPYFIYGQVGMYESLIDSAGVDDCQRIRIVGPFSVGVFCSRQVGYGIRCCCDKLELAFDLC